MTRSARHLDGRVEHQRKFRVADLSQLSHLLHNSQRIEQGYLWIDGGWHVRVRRTWVGDDKPGFSAEVSSVLALKGPPRGFTRPEYEMEIDIPHAVELMTGCIGKITKTRYSSIDHSTGLPWIVDQFHDANRGLILVEIELEDAARLASLLPPTWAVEEVTWDRKYSNSSLSVVPYTTWKHDVDD
jgi:adenylate cyclase